MSECIGKDLIGEYWHKLLDHTKKSAADARKTNSKK